MVYSVTFSALANTIWSIDLENLVLEVGLRLKGYVVRCNLEKSYL